MSEKILRSEPESDKKSSGFTFKNDFWSKPVSKEAITLPQPNLLIFVVQASDEFQVVSVNTKTKVLVHYNSKPSLKSKIDLDKFKFYAESKYECKGDIWSYELGICPNVSEHVHSGVIMSHLIKLILTKGDLE